MSWTYKNMICDAIMKKKKIVVLAFGVKPIIVERSKKPRSSKYPRGKRISFTLFAKIH